MAGAKVFAFINYKGGVAKTTSAYHIGCWLSEVKNKNVLLVDIDPQTNLTFLCASIEEWERRKSRVGTIADMYKRYLNKIPIDTGRYIWKTPIRLRGGNFLPRIDLVPCDIDLIGEDIGGGQISGAYPSMEMLKRNAEQFMRDREFLSKAIDEVRHKYDYVLIDCPPNLYLMTQNALVASNHYIVTAIPDHLSTIGLNILRNKVEKIDSLAESAATLAGANTDRGRLAEFGAVLFVRVRIGGSMLTNAHASKMEDIRSSLGSDRCFETYTTELIGYTEAAESSLPVWLHDSANAGRARAKQEYPKIVDELLGEVLMGNSKQSMAKKLDTFLSKMSELVDTLPTQETKSSVEKDLGALIQFLTDFQSRLRELPTDQDANNLTSTIETIRDYVRLAESDPLMSRVLGLSESVTPRKPTPLTEQSRREAESIAGTLKALAPEDVERRLADKKKYNVPMLKQIGKELGLHIPSKASRISIMEKIVKKTANLRGYDHLRQGPSGNIGRRVL